MDQDAEQYWNGDAEPAWSAAVQKPVRVEARQVTGQPEEIEMGPHVITVHPGDWIVRYPSGQVKAFRKEDFDDLFARARGQDQSDDVTPGVSI
jgi:sarcosine oxidase gamma subunit